MATAGTMILSRSYAHSRSIRSLKRSSGGYSSPLASPPMVASPEDTKSMDYAASVDHLITMPRNIDEPLVSFLLQSIVKFPLVFAAVQSSVTSLSRNREMDGFVEAYGEDAAEALIFVAFLYAMGIDLQAKHGIQAPDVLPHDLTLRETIGVFHLAELFDLDPLRRISRLKIDDHFSRPIRPQEFEWAFGSGAKITGALTYLPEVPLKIALCDRYTRSWDYKMSEVDETLLLNLGRENIEFYLLVKSFCLGHVNDEGVNDV
jgi:hypothetical protein